MSLQSAEKPVVGVGAVIFHREKVLLIKRSKPPMKDQWSLPGGKQELGETLIEAALREVFEETGINPEIKGLIDAVDFIDRDQDGSVLHHYSLIDYWGICNGETPTAASDAKDAKFYSLDDALGLPLWSETRRIIKMADALRGAT